MKFLNLLLILYLILNCTPLSSFNLEWEFNINFKSFLSKLKSSTPEFIKNIQKNMEEFIKKTEKDKDKYINTLSKKVEESFNKIKNGMKKGTSKYQNEIKTLIEKTTETANALKYKLCDISKEENEQCINNKKNIFKNLLNIIQENFGKCSIIVNEILNLSENIEKNLKYFLFLSISLTENPDLIQKGTSQIVYDIINCLQEKFEYLWPSINSKIIKKKD